MDAFKEREEDLRRQIADAEDTIQKLKTQLDQHLKTSLVVGGNPESRAESSPKWPLLPEEYRRYGRQMIVPSIGIQGQLRLKNARVLIVGAGGLGCPAAAYIAGSGIGTIGLVDGDVVEISNLHRQILHNTSTIGMKKVDSIISYLKSQVPSLRLNPLPNYIAHPEHLTPETAASIVTDYDVVLDCTDHPTSRYLISDICVLLQKPLVSASALRTDGQLIVLNRPALAPGQSHGGPCYRCIFPKPPPAESVVSCGDGGIIGPVVGVMGTLQALETIKLISAGRLSAERREKPPSASMLLFSAIGDTPFRSLKMRPRKPDCFACSQAAQLSLESLASGSLDYVKFCGTAVPEKSLAPGQRISAAEYQKIREGETSHLLLDVREKVQYDICHIGGSVNIPFSTIQGFKPEQLMHVIPDSLPPEAPVYVICRMGNDSQIVTNKLHELGLHKDGSRYIGDIKGGFNSWRRDVDGSWPEY